MAVILLPIAALIGLTISQVMKSSAIRDDALRAQKDIENFLRVREVVRRVQVKIWSNIPQLVENNGLLDFALCGGRNWFIIFFHIYTRTGWKRSYLSIHCLEYYRQSNLYLCRWCPTAVRYRYEESGPLAKNRQISDSHENQSKPAVVSGEPQSKGRSWKLPYFLF